MIVYPKTPPILEARAVYALMRECALQFVDDAWAEIEWVINFMER